MAQFPTEHAHYTNAPLQPSQDASPASPGNVRHHAWASSHSECRVNARRSASAATWMNRSSSASPSARRHPGTLGPHGALPGPTLDHGHRRRGSRRTAPRPGRLHHRPRSRTRHRLGFRVGTEQVDASAVQVTWETRGADLTTMMDSSTFAEVCPAPCRLHRREDLPFPCPAWTVRAVVPMTLTASGARAIEAFVRLAPQARAGDARRTRRRRPAAGCRGGRCRFRRERGLAR